MIINNISDNDILFFICLKPHFRIDIHCGINETLLQTEQTNLDIANTNFLPITSVEINHFFNLFKSV
jgi:hypothetical protein